LARCDGAVGVLIANACLGERGEEGIVIRVGVRWYGHGD
jgi:hypothetical protein